jgi:hypothetical protein
VISRSAGRKTTALQGITAFGTAISHVTESYKALAEKDYEPIDEEA